MSKDTTGNASSETARAVNRILDDRYEGGKLALIRGESLKTVLLGLYLRGFMDALAHTDPPTTETDHE